MKKLFGLGGFLTFAGMMLLLASPGDGHKVYWCHYPPGNWGGTPENSKVILLDIDKSAPGWEKTVAKHLGHSPLLQGGAWAEGESTDGTASGCPNTGCGYADIFDATDFSTKPVKLESSNGQCVCPQGTPNAGKLPEPNCGSIG